ALPEDMTMTDALAGETQFSRLPLFKVDIDDANSFVLKDDVLLFKAQNRGEAQLKTLKRDIMVVPREMPISALMETFLDRRQHIALVVDEYGGTNGLVTFEDVVETLLGEEIIDEMDKEEDMQALARRRWEKRAQTLGLKVDEAVNGETKHGPADHGTPNEN
ncbi:MAG: CBS domain-containing protein, partial [Planctomycetes bacterium]|nr:CBS domain-containing protein [Planctomycetota bacterium]